MKSDYQGQKLALHDYFLAKSLDALRPGGVLAVGSTHFTLDKQNGATCELLADRADFLGAVRLPSDAFKAEGTAVVTDILFLRKRAKADPARPADPDWLTTAPLTIDEKTVSINQYFHHHPEMVLGDWSSRDTLYAGGYSVKSNGDLAAQLRAAVDRLPKLAPRVTELSPASSPAPAFVPPHDTPTSEGSFVVGADRRIDQQVDGGLQHVVYGGTELASGGTLVGKRIAALIGLRDRARRVLQSQNEGWPEANRVEAHAGR